MRKNEKGRKGLSIITCVTDNTMYENLKRSIDNHCSCEHEFLSYDNRNGDKSMSQVYNILAKQAKYNTLLLIHQDVLFLEGNISKIVDKINADKECGYIGFAGGKVKLNTYTGWFNSNTMKYHVCNYCQTETKYYVYQSTKTPYDDVVTLDGLALFTRKSFYLEYPLDENLIDNFHCYDIYLTVNAFVNGYNNYVYTNEDIKIIHFSRGNYNIGWFNTTKRLTDEIWNEYGDLVTDNLEISDEELLKLNKEVEYSFINNYETLKLRSGRRVLYTCITGGYEKLKPVKQEQGWDYVCFTDEPFECDGWDVRPLPDEVSGLSTVKKQRFIKINPHLWFKDYSLSIWVDGNMAINGNLDEFISKTNISNVKPITFKVHPGRDCIYDELIACVDWKRETIENTEKLRKFYQEEGMPRHYGLYETNIIVRFHNNPECIRLMKMWSDELVKKSHRDQLSLTYCIWKLSNKNKINNCSFKIMNDYFTHMPHSNNV